MLQYSNAWFKSEGNGTIVTVGLKIGGDLGFDAGHKTVGACRGAGASLNCLQKISCQRRQLRLSGLTAEPRDFHV